MRSERVHARNISHDLQGTTLSKRRDGAACERVSVPVSVNSSITASQGENESLLK